jgi:hypothetical protein
MIVRHDRLVNRADSGHGFRGRVSDLKESLHTRAASTEGSKAQCAVTRFAVIVPVNATSGVPFSLNSVPLSGEPG